MKLINYRPPIILAIILISGILVGYYGGENSFLFWLVPSTVFCLYLIAFIACKKHRLNVAIMFLLSVLLFLSGMVISINKVNAYESNYVVYGKYDFGGRVSSEISSKYDDKIYEIDHIFIDGKNYDSSVKAYVYVENALSVGDVIKGNGVVDNSTKMNFFTDRVRFEINVHEYEKVSHIENFFDKISIKTEKLYQKNMTEKSYPVALALFLGNTTKIDGEELSLFRLNGLAHIFAVSGLHIGFMYLLITFVLKKVKCKEVLRKVLTAIFLITYSGVCGFKPSSMRAVIMCLFLMFAIGYGVKYDGLNALFSSMILVLLINAGNLFDVGFMLSYSTVFGIIAFAPTVKNVLKFLPDKFSTAISCSVSASLFSMPFCFYYFGYVSPFGVLLNLIAIPVISIVYYVLFISSVICIILPFLSVILKFSAVIIEGFRYLTLLIDSSGYVLQANYTAVTCISSEIALVSVSDVINLGKISKILIFIAIITITCLNIILGVL